MLTRRCWMPCLSQGPLTAGNLVRQRKASIAARSLIKNISKFNCLHVFFLEFGKDVAFNFCRYMYKCSRLTLETVDMAFV